MIEAIDELDVTQLSAVLTYWLPKSFPKRFRLIVSVNDRNTPSLDFFKKNGAFIETSSIFAEDLESLKNQYVREDQEDGGFLNKFIKQVDGECNFRRLDMKLRLVRMMYEEGYTDNSITEMLSITFFT